MIPSRPLSFGEIFAQTFSMFGRTFTRYLLLFALLYLPGAALLPVGTAELTRSFLTTAQRDGGFTDNDLVILRNRMRDSLAKDNPAFREQLQESSERDTLGAKADLDTLFSNKVDRAFKSGDFFQKHLDAFTPSLALLGGGLLLFTLGLLALTAAITDLTCQAFEERKLEVGWTLRSTFKRFLWVMLGLYTILFVFRMAIDAVSNALYNAAPLAGAFFALIVFAINLFIIVRFALAVPALVSESLGPIASLRRSWDLTRGSSLRVFGILVGLGVVFFGIAMVVLVLCSIIFAGTAVEWWLHFLKDPAVSIAKTIEGVSGFVQAMVLILSLSFLLIFPFLPISSTILYYDLRTRREGPLDYDDEGSVTEELPTAMWQP